MNFQFSSCRKRFHLLLFIRKSSGQATGVRWWLWGLGGMSRTEARALLEVLCLCVLVFQSTLPITPKITGRHALFQCFGVCKERASFPAKVSKFIFKSQGLGMSSVVEYLSSIPKSLGSIPSTCKTSKQKATQDVCAWTYISPGVHTCKLSYLGNRGSKIWHIQSGWLTTWWDSILN